MEYRDKVIRWAQMLRQIRRYFDSADFVEVSTPQMVRAGAFESCLDSLKVSFSDGDAELNTSPEIEMKWVMAQTGLSIYQICKSYRDDPITEIHFKEFTMLEFYRVEANFVDVKKDLVALLKALDARLPPVLEVSMRDLVLKITGIDLEIARDGKSLRGEIERRNTIQISAGDTWDDMFLKLLIEKVEPGMDFETPTLVTHFPGSFAALAKIDPGSGYAERFELYWRGIELANGCTELRNASELRKRFEHECEARMAQGKVPHPYPEKLFAAVEKLPDCAGVAVGLDRLFMALIR
jgi:lysyl-tRNA synthetase class 2